METKLLDIKQGTYVTPKVSPAYVKFSDDIRLVRELHEGLDAEGSVCFKIERGEVVERLGAVRREGQWIFLGVEDIKIIHA